MTKKIIVSKEWHSKAMAALYESDKKQKEDSAFVKGLQSFLITVLTPEQQRKLEGEIESFMQGWE
tara:strand:+ start:506 stop:700 length:195 start_codon:yes stop_codon:yes gene_type:complete